MISLSPSINNSEEGIKRIDFLSSSFTPSFVGVGVEEEEEEEVEGIAGG